MRQRVVYTVMDRDSIAESIAPNRVQTVHVDKRYDLEGNLTSLARASVPNSTGIGTITTQWRYDRANRRVAEVAPDAMVDSTVYDPAGNPVVAVTRRKDPTSGVRISVTMGYNALNQLASRALPAVSYPSRASNLLTWPNHVNTYPAYQVPVDTQAFAYDPMGRVLTAENVDAKIKRSYYPNGLLQTDSLRIQTVGHTDWNAHRYGVEHTYDLDGRQRFLRVPQQLLTTGLLPNVTFTYDSQLGHLQSVSDLQNNLYSFAYTIREDLDSLTYPAAYVERFRYDADGRLATDTVLNRGGTSFPRLQGQIVRAASYGYDAQGRLLVSRDPLGFQDTLAVTYSGLGHIATSKVTERAMLEVGTDWYAARFASAETFTFDALGNRSYSETRDTSTDQGGRNTTGGTIHQSAYQPGTGRLRTDAINGSTNTFTYDSVGNIVFATNPGLVGHPGEERASYYAADGTLRAVDWRWTAYAGDPTFRPEKYSFDEYRYDALGRRVWVWSKKDCVNIDYQTRWWELAECKSSLLRRTVWDGDQEVAEIQMPGDTTGVEAGLHENDVAPVNLGPLPNCVDRSPFFGRVLYTPGRAIDQPIAVTRINYEYQHPDEGPYCIPQRTLTVITTMPFWNRNGDAPIGVFTNGARKLCETPNQLGVCVGGSR